MVGRAAISNPWRLRDIIRNVQGLPPLPPPTLCERIETALEHLRFAIEDDEELKAVRSLRGQIPLYIKSEPGAAALRNELVRMLSYREIEDRLFRFEIEVQKPLAMEFASR